VNPKLRESRFTSDTFATFNRELEVQPNPVGVNPLSADIDRSEITRSTVITGVLTGIFTVLIVAFWAWSAPEIESPVTWLQSQNPFIVPILEILLVFGFFIFLSVTFVNLRLYLTKIRAGWFDILVLFIVVALISYFSFGQDVAIASLVLCLGFVVYLYLLQE
jgi:hypothetical protein